MAVTAQTIDPEAPYARVGMPPLGFRNYWYPIVTARDVGHRPKAVTLLGEQIVLFRDGGKLYALEDRCPHRGIRLSAGGGKFPGSGTSTCASPRWALTGPHRSPAA